MIVRTTSTMCYATSIAWHHQTVLRILMRYPCASNAIHSAIRKRPRLRSSSHLAASESALGDVREFSESAPDRELVTRGCRLDFCTHHRDVEIGDVLHWHLFTVKLE